MDAIVKAAELAAEAISQAGKIVAMGDPLPLTELLEFGPEGYWKVSRESTELVGKSIEVNREQLSNDIVGEGPDSSTKHQKDGPSEKETKSTTHEKSHLQTEMPKESMVDHMRLVDGISAPIPTNETDSRVQKGRKVSDLAKTIGVVPESEIGSRSTVQNEYEKVAETFKEDSIKEGSHVEVLKDTDGFKAAWFTANVLGLEDGKAYVCYTELQTDNAEGQLKEWVSLQGEGDKVPKIRTARPVTIMRYEGTRKRRRAAMGDYNWSVGDRVDAWIRDSWCEGIITEKNKKDETELTVHFPAQGETSVVRAWHLRPSLIWKDGEWIEWSNLRENVSASHEGDMPQEKRIKLGSPAAEAKGKDKMLESKGVVELGKSEESRLLDLSENEKLFNVGKNTRNENKPDALRTLRTGLQKEGSRVVIGVPKPGKKRKFMEVSKHYVADRGNKINEPNDSVKFVKYLMPQGSGSRGWKNSTKSSILKEKRVAETKPRGLKTGKPQSVSGRTVPAKDNLSINAVSAPDDGILTNLLAKVKDSVSHAENASGKHNQFDIGSLSSTLGTAEGPILFSSRASSSDGSSKKVSTSNAKSERANKGKLAPAGGKLAKIEEDKIFNGSSAKSTSEVVEPRRSNRRIQPTSTEPCGSSLLLSLPYDIFAIVSWTLSPRDLCNLSLCCRSLCALMATEKVWLTRCEMMGILSHRDLIEWRKGVSSYKALCRFLICVEPLIGIWVHQNPELGNVVYVMPGFISVVGCRIIPQELGPLGIEDGPILWAPVFEVVGNSDGSATLFLHGRDKGQDFFYPGSVKPVERACNVLLLEVETRQQENGDELLHSKSFAPLSDKDLRKVCRSNSGISRSQRVLGQNEVKVPFSRLGFCDRRKLLHVVTTQVRQKVPEWAYGPLFPRLRDDEENFQKDLVLLLERRSLLMHMYRHGGCQIDWKASPELSTDPSQMELSQIRKSLDHPSGFCISRSDDGSHTQYTKRKGLGGYVRDSLKHILGKSSSTNGSDAISKNGSSSSEHKHAQLHEFLRSDDTIRLALHAANVKLSSYRAWPNMHESRFALYKLPMRVPTADQDYAGLWGGTFGWPPGRPSTDKPGKALFFLLLSYEESQGQRNLIATKILEGTHYVLHPNGSAMFIVNIDEPSLDPFPFETDADSLPVNVKHAFMGEGIANGYGFRYPGSKPGSLFVFQNGLLAFIWKESRAILTLQRLNLQELLRKGERVPPLPPIANFSYLTKSYSNVFAGFPNNSTCLSSPRFPQCNDIRTSRLQQNMP